MTECLLIDCRGCSPEQYQGILALIPQERRELAESYRHFSDKVMSAVSGLCQELVRLKSGCELYRDENGKPQCVGGSHHFNISHSGMFVVLAYSDEPVGVDVQTLITCPDAVKWVLSQEETDVVGVSSSPEMLTKIWCRKESVLKLIGTGIRLEPKSVNILDDESVPEGYTFSEMGNDEISICVCHKGECIFSEIGLEELADYVDPRFRPRSV